MKNLQSALQEMLQNTSPSLKNKKLFTPHEILLYIKKGQEEPIWWKATLSS